MFSFIVMLRFARTWIRVPNISNFSRCCSFPTFLVKVKYWVRLAVSLVYVSFCCISWNKLLSITTELTIDDWWSGNVMINEHGIECFKQNLFLNCIAWWKTRVHLNCLRSGCYGHSFDHFGTLQGWLELLFLVAIFHLQ